jgi:GNAT superfamily N-acetyltransferase
MNYRLATALDVPQLALMNQALIRDEGHRNRMSLSELEQRMTGWLNDDYRVIIFERDRTAVGYSLFRNEPEHVYLGQFYVHPESRRQGIGRAAIEWILANVWDSAARIRLDVLIGNHDGIAFWRAVGFCDYALTMERDSRIE